MVKRHGVEAIAEFIATARIIRWPTPANICFERHILLPEHTQLLPRIEDTLTKTAAFIGQLINVSLTAIPGDRCDILVVPFSGSYEGFSVAWRHWHFERQKLNDRGMVQAIQGSHDPFPTSDEYFIGPRGNDASQLLSFVRLDQEAISDPDKALAYAAAGYGGYVRGNSDEPITPFRVPILDHARNRLTLLVIIYRSGVVQADDPDARFVKVNRYLRSGAFGN